MDSSNDVAVVVTVPTITEKKELVLPEKTDGLTLGDYVPVLQQYRDINKALVFDYRGKEGNAAARSHVAKLRRIKAPLGDIHKRLKADYLKITTKLDADKREALALVEEMIQHHHKEIEKVEAEEKAEAEKKKIEAEISEVWDLAHEMNAMHDRQKELDRQATEQNRIAEQQREKQREIEHRDQVNKAAEKAAADAKRQAEAEAREKEAARIEEEKRAAADLENIKRIHWLIIPELIKFTGITEDQAKGVILAVRDGSIPAMSIDYRWEG